MKKIIALFIMFFAFSLGSNAQTAAAKVNIEEKAKLNVVEISKAMNINESDALYSDLQRLFLKKYKNLSKENITEAEKQQIYSVIDYKLKATFSELQIENLKAIPGLYDRLLK